MAIQIQLRNDTAANWVAANPILSRGEIGIEIDTNKMKIGNGTNSWNDVAYTGVDAAELLPLISYNHSQGVASDTWSINHNLGFYPSVTVFDSAANEVEGAIVHNDLNNLTITFSAAISGSANLS